MIIGVSFVLSVAEEAHDGEEICQGSVSKALASEEEA